MTSSSISSIEDETARETVQDIQTQIKKMEQTIQILRFVSANVRTSLNSIAKNVANYAAPVERLLKYERHVHYAHIHGCCHQYFQYGRAKGDEDEKSCLFTPRTQTIPCLSFAKNITEDYDSLAPGQVLALEYSQFEDKDNNGYIYGHDFVVNPSDSKQPPAVKQLTRRISGYLKLPMLSWASYLATTSRYARWQVGKEW